MPDGVDQLAEGRLDVDSDVTLVGAGIGQTLIRGGQQLGDRVFHERDRQRDQLAADDE